MSLHLIVCASCLVAVLTAHSAWAEPPKPKDGPLGMKFVPMPKGAFYMGWNLFVVVPVLYLVNHGGSASRIDGFIWMSAVYALALAVWIVGKRWCLRRAKYARKQEV